MAPLPTKLALHLNKANKAVHRQLPSHLDLYNKALFLPWSHKCQNKSSFRLECVKVQIMKALQIHKLPDYTYNLQVTNSLTRSMSSCRLVWDPSVNSWPSTSPCKPLTRSSILQQRPTICQLGYSQSQLFSEALMEHQQVSLHSIHSALLHGAFKTSLYCQQ